MNLSEKFSQLHAGSHPFILGNIWDVASAHAFAGSGYKAIGTSSQAVAIANGYKDGEELPFSILLQLAKKVVEQTDIPFTVDLEGGYARSIAGITDNISKLHDAGVVGINLEDTIASGGRKFLAVDEFAKILAAVADHISQHNLGIFLNVRTDGFLLGLPNALEETLKRIKPYQDAGANGLFTPCITAAADIRAVVNATSLPVNVMCMPGLPGFDELAALGVKRISMGGFLFNKIYKTVQDLGQAVAREKNFSSILF